MICALKRLDQLQVKFVDMDKLSMDKTGFTKITSRKAVPVLRHGDDIIDDPMEIGEYLEKIFPDPSLASKNQRAVAAGVNNAFAKFSALIRNREPSKDNILRDHLIEELRKLDGFLRSDESPGVFLDGDELKLPDCYLLPKLYQIKVAAGELKGFTIPEEFAAVKRYLKTAEKTPEFKHTAPLEEEIVLGWKRKMTWGTRATSASEALWNKSGIAGRATLKRGQGQRLKWLQRGVRAREAAFSVIAHQGFLDARSSLH